jgi:hypothetical protein
VRQASLLEFDDIHVIFWTEEMLDFSNEFRELSLEQKGWEKK